MNPAQDVTAVVVSRMNRPLGPVLDSIIPHVRELIVVRGVGGVWDRWQAAAAASTPVVYTQDDDAIVDVPAVLDAYEAGAITCNMPADRRPEYPDGIALVGWGAVFDQELVSCATGGYRMRSCGNARPFCRYFRRFPTGLDELFRSECDRVFTGLAERLKLLDVAFDHQPAAHGMDRMGRRPDHGVFMRRIRQRIAEAKAAC